jgi:hypothetical protein
MPEEEIHRHDVDERVLKLAGDASSLLLTGARRYFDSFEMTAIEEGLSGGSVCLVKLSGMRLYIYQDANQVAVIVMELGYRRKFKKVAGSSLEEVVQKLPKAVASQIKDLPSR